MQLWLILGGGVMFAVLAGYLITRKRPGRARTGRPETSALKSGHTKNRHMADAQRATAQRATAPAPAQVPAPAPAPNPVPDPVPDPDAKPPAAHLDKDNHPLSIRVKPVTLTRSLMAATLNCKVIFGNRTAAAIGPIAVSADISSAHAKRRLDEQMAGPDAALPRIATIETVEAGQLAEVAMILRLPVSAMHLIRQGDAALYVPLLRLSADIEQDAGSKDEHQPPLSQTFVIGRTPTKSSGKRLQPFRYDEMAQTYRNIVARALA